MLINGINVTGRNHDAKKGAKMSDTATITAAEITALPKTWLDDMPKVIVALDNGTVDLELFSYYPDEISFTASEFVGLTVGQAFALRHKRDVSYLQS